jgi:ribonuclease P/MRP protein subunit POP5
MTVLNPLPSSKRERNRYIVFEVISEDGSFDMKAVSTALWDSFLNLVGELGAARSGFRMVDWDKNSGKGIIKTVHTSADEAKIALSLVTEMDGKKVVINVPTVSGILKKARQRAGIKPKPRS